MSKPRVKWFLTAASMSIVLGLGGVSLPVEGAEPVLQGPKEALEDDLRAAAKAHGWTLEQAYAREHAGDEVARIQRKIRQERPGIFIGASHAEKIGNSPSIYVKGPAPQFVRDLVNNADVPIRIVDGQPFSFDELEARSIKVFRALVDAGYEQVSVYTNITGSGTIPSAVLRTPGLPGNPQGVLDLVPQGLRASVELRINDADFVRPQHVIGGARTRRSTPPYGDCTSGFVVKKVGSTTKGVTDAGHCGFIDKMHESNSHNLTLKAEHLGPWGDVEWFTSPAEKEPRFRSSPDNIREVYSVKPRDDMMVGDIVCLYGKTSNQKNCSLTILDKGAHCAGDGNEYWRMVVMNGNVGEEGDSGAHGSRAMPHGAVTMDPAISLPFRTETYSAQQSCSRTPWTSKCGSRSNPEWTRGRGCTQPNTRWTRQET